MRYYVLALLLSLAGILSAVPVLQSAINTEMYYVTASNTRCVTGYYDPLNFGTAITHLTLWNTENPPYPRAGITLSNYQWNGWHAYRQPTVYQHYLLYMDEFRLNILDISNVDIPVTVAQMNIGQTYCFAIMEHYLVRGNQDGTLDMYDLSNPSTPRFMSSTPSLPAIWSMWYSDGRLAVRCGHFANNTAKLFELDAASETLTEVASVTLDGKLSYVGQCQERMILQREDESIRIYEIGMGSTPVLAADIPASDKNKQIIANEGKIISISTSNCVRIWHLDNDNEMLQTGYYDLSHLSLARGWLYSLEGNILTYSVDNVLCLFLDISDLAESPATLSTICDGKVYGSAIMVEDSEHVYYINADRISALKLDSDGRLSSDGDLADTNGGLQIRSTKQHLYHLTQRDGALRTRIMRIDATQNPVLLADIPSPSHEFYAVKQDFLYQGSLTTVEKYRVTPAGTPVWERNLSYTYQEWGMPVYWYDIASDGNTDYGVGMFGNWFTGYYPILVYWRADGSTGYRILHKFMQKVHVVSGHLYLSGWGLMVFQLGVGNAPLEVFTGFQNLLFTSTASSTLVDDRYLMECYQLSNSICVYDLINPRNPQLISIIRQPHTSRMLAGRGNVLISANGLHGMTSYRMYGNVSNEDPHVPAVPAISAHPNPFKGSVSIKFSQHSPGVAVIECYNIKGQMVLSRRMEDAKAGLNSYVWDGRDDAGRSCPAGVYLLRIRTPQGVSTGKITKLK